MHDMKTSDVKQSDTKLSFELNGDRASRKENEVKVNKAVDEKLYNLRLELAKEKKSREECQERYEETFGTQLQQIQEAIVEENKEREESQQVLVSVLSDEVGKFHAQLQ